MIAAEKGRIETMRLLISANADVDMHAPAAPDDDEQGFTPPPLVLALAGGYLECATLLLARSGTTSTR